VISVGAKKKELVGDFKNGAREWQSQNKPEWVRTHDFGNKELLKEALLRNRRPSRLRASTVKNWPVGIAVGGVSADPARSERTISSPGIATDLSMSMPAGPTANIVTVGNVTFCEPKLRDRKWRSML
jgi:hypothetical protein